jgi:histone deacetylase complex regulatory component SIN3
MCYIFLRLHQTVYARLRIARMLALDLQQQQLATGCSTGPANTSSVPTNDAPSSFASSASNASVNSTTLGSNNRSLYGHFLGGLQGLVEGSMDNTRFEDFVRNLLGNRAYPLYTLDKLISQLVKHLVAMANDDNVNKLVGLFVYHSFHRDAVDPTLYRSHVAQILSHTSEEVFRIQVPSTAIASRHSLQLTKSHFFFR